MSVLNRLYTFVPFTTIASAEVNAELNQILNLLNGTDNTNQAVIGAVVPINTAAKLVLGGQLELQQAANGEVIRVFSASDIVNPRVAISNLGRIKVRAGALGTTPADQQMYVGGTLYCKSDNVGNVGAGEDDLKSFTLGANLFGNSGTNHAEFKYRGYTAANGNNKRLRFYGKTTAIMDSGVMTENNKPWFLDGEIVQDADGVSTVTICGIFRCGATEVRFNTQLTGYDFTVDNVWKMTAEAVATDDLVNNLMVVNIGQGLN